MLCYKTKTKIYWTILFSVGALAVLVVWQTNREYDVAQNLYIATLETQNVKNARGWLVRGDNPSVLNGKQMALKMKLGAITCQINDVFDTETYVLFIAKKFGLNPQKFYDVAKCESGFIPQQSKIWYNSQRENSWGIWQINLDWHPEVTREQAMDIEWSTEWSAKQWIAGNAHWWTCWKNQLKNY